MIISITTLEDSLRRKLEPRSATVQKRLITIRELKKAGIQVGVLIGPVIPGLNNQEIPSIIEATSEAGAEYAAYSMIRLNGDLGIVFRNWLQSHFPDRAD